ncbi:hypothetical protein PM082_015165 [Marasmius tenuissimus]|nr:hypothetical protein PM082_015165 [Marasmius tenuissimus]
MRDTQRKEGDDIQRHWIRKNMKDRLDQHQTSANLNDLQLSKNTGKSEHERNVTGKLRPSTSSRLLEADSINAQSFLLELCPLERSALALVLASRALDLNQWLPSSRNHIRCRPTLAPQCINDILLPLNSVFFHRSTYGRHLLTKQFLSSFPYTQVLSRSWPSERTTRKGRV